MLKKVWVDPVWSKVIAAAIVAAVASIATYFAGWWPAIAAFTSKAGSLAISSTLVPNWLLTILVVSTISILVLLGVAMWTILFSSDSAPSFRDYTEDVVLGVRWRWLYGRDGTLYNLVSFCPRCDYQIFARNSSAYRAVDSLEFRCEDCGALAAHFEIPLEEIESRVMRHIHKKLRTGSWSKVANVQPHVAADGRQRRAAERDR